MKTEEIRVLVDSIQPIRLSMKQYVQRKLREGNFDITFEMLQVLVLLWREQNLNQKEIADMLSKNKASITPLLDKLSEKKLVVRTEDPSDRRNKIISLTKSGKEYQTYFQPVVREMYEIIMGGLTSDEIQLATRVLQTMDQNLKNIE